MNPYPLVAAHHDKETDSDFISVQNLFEIARQNLFLLLGIPLAASLIGLYVVLAQTPLYKATTLVQLDPKPTQPMARNAELYDPGYETSSYYLTQLEIIKSRKLAVTLVDRLALDKVSEFSDDGTVAPSITEQLLSLLPGIGPAPEPQLLDETEIHNRVLNRTKGAITAELAPGTTLIRIGFQSSNPKLAAEAANALADIYIEELLQARLDIYTKATRWISEKLGNVGQDLNAAESNLQSYRESRKLLNVGGNRGLAEDDLQDLSKRLREARQRRSQLENQHNEIRKLMRSPESVGDAQSLLLDPIVRSAVQTYSTENAKLKSLERRYGKRHPQYLIAEGQFKEAEANYLKQLQIKAGGLESELSIARSNEQQLENVESSSRKRLQQLDRDEFKLNMLERDVRSNRQLYDVFLARFNETESSSSFSETNARVADPAVPPGAPFWPSKRKAMAISLALGALLAIVLVLLRQLLRTKLEIPDDIEALTNIPLIGVLPYCNDRLLKKSAIEFLEKNPQQPFSDAIRSIKTALLMASKIDKGNDGYIMAITSAEPSEGKTTISAALGASISATLKVLLIDGDMRRPKLTSHIGKSSRQSPGLADVLLNGTSVDECIIQDEHSNVHFLPAGRPTHNPALLLESDQFGAILGDLKKQFELILIDTPPVLATSDALHLTKLIDGFLLIARAEKTPRKAFLGALKRLDTVNAKHVGIVMNGATAKRNTYAGYYYHGSSYGYSPRA